MPYVSRRDFLKLSTSAIAGMGLSPFLPGLGTFDDSLQVRVATKSVSVHSASSDQSRIVMQRFRDELVMRNDDYAAPLFFGDTAQEMHDLLSNLGI